MNSYISLVWPGVRLRNTKVEYFWVTAWPSSTYWIIERHRCMLKLPPNFQDYPWLLSGVLIWEFFVKLGNIWIYKLKMAVKCRCFLFIWYHTFPNISRISFNYPWSIATGYDYDKTIANPFFFFKNEFFRQVLTNQSQPLVIFQPSVYDYFSLKSESHLIPPTPQTPIWPGSDVISLLPFLVHPKDSWKRA